MEELVNNWNILKFISCYSRFEPKIVNLFEGFYERLFHLKYTLKKRNSEYIYHRRKSKASSGCQGNQTIFQKSQKIIKHKTENIQDSSHDIPEVRYNILIPKGSESLYRNPGWRQWFNASRPSCLRWVCHRVRAMFRCRAGIVRVSFCQ